jgi:hypothetical protein
VSADRQLGRVEEPFDNASGRSEMTYANGGPVRFFIDGVKVLERKLTVSDPAGTKAHWDAGLYNHAAGVTTRTVYISNLSVGTK